MKKIFKSLILVAAAAMGFTACQEELQGEDYANEGTVVVSFVTDTPETKTSVDTSGETPVFAWDAEESFVVLEQTDALAEATSVAYAKVDGKAKIDAEFATNAGKSEYKYVTVYPETAYVSAESIDEATLKLPAEQIMTTGSYDPAADLMVSEVVTVNAQPTEAQMVAFTRLAAVAKMTLKNLELGAGEQVEKVIFTAAGKKLAGTVTADLADPHKFAVAEGVDNVSVTATSNEVLFTVLPTTLEAGDAYTVTVITDKYLYVKNGVIPEEKSLVFEAGMVTRFNVDMSGVDPSEKWVLVRDASTLSEGDIVTIAAVNNNFVLGCNSSDNFPYASYNTDIVKVGDYLYHPIVTDKSKYQYMVQPLILAKQDANKAAFDFYNGVDYEGDTKTGYLTNAQTDNFLKRFAYPSKNSAFEISISEGVATIEAKESEWDNTLLKFFNYNPNSNTSTYRRFVCIDAANMNATKHDDISIYKLAGKTGVVPTAGAVVTVPDADEPVVVPVEGVAMATAFEDVKFTYVGDWTITAATDDAGNWLTLDYADGVLKYSADANPGTVRYATVTITATHENEADKTWSFKVVQKGAPVKATVAEFIEFAKTENPYVEYEVTGILLSKPSSPSGTTKIKDADGNEASFKYVYMDDNETSIKDNDNIQNDDVVTIVAAVVNENEGGASSAHAICKGYYNLKAEVENDLVAYTGGSVEIALNKLGTLDPAGNITAEADAAFAKVTYTDNAEEATVVFDPNDGAPRQAVVTFTDGLAKASVAVVQSADPAKGNTWELVTDASTLSAYDQVIIAAKDYDVAMSTTISSERRSAVAVTKLGNHYLTPDLGVQTLVLANGSAEGTFAFYDGDNKGFLVSSNTSTSYLKNQGYIDNNTSFAISITDGVATIGNKEGSYSSNKVQYYQSNNYFYSGSSAKQPVCLYRLVGGKGTIPVIPADVTVPESSKKVVVPEEGAAEATPINDVVFNYVGDWTITASVPAEVDWITFEFDKVSNKLTYKADKNEGIVRETTATITASMDGQESKTWTFNILQKGAPVEITCDALNDKVKNVDVSYKLTGRIVSMTSPSSGTFMLDDGSGRQAKITYLFTDDNKQVYNNEDIDLAVGDVVTVTTTVYSNGYGGNTNYHSTYKGHYRLTATADKDLVGYEGGDVTFTLATSGNLVPEGETIKGAMAEAYDFVTFDYTENAATATFAVNSGASREAEFNFTFGLASVSVAVGQYNHPDVKVGWFLVTDVNELAVGDKVIIAAKTPDGTLDYAIKTWTSTSSTSTSKQIALMGNSIKDVTDLEQFTIASGADAYPNTFAFVRADGRYLSNSSGSLKTSTTLGEYTSWGVTIDSSNNGAATLTVSKASSSKDTIMFNYTAYNQLFNLFKPTDTGKGAIYIYKYYNSLAQ